ncbi:hypothetical protein DPMN_126493 [Dreissena polymorpha]|uniref:Uncharacterized protein n=1 Tax=Dreissena polymorpha TaxID=45954 RepID=A0A9D4GZL8_DREPO|nr:hypothetical protein DPMN_126493 [Dreissena polymorpha]
MVEGGENISRELLITDLQYHREAAIPIWSRDLENNCHHHKDNTGLHNHVPQEDPRDPLARQDPQRTIMEKNKAAAPCEFGWSSPYLTGETSPAALKWLKLAVLCPGRFQSVSLNTIVYYYTKYRYDMHARRIQSTDYEECGIIFEDSM